MTKAFKPVAKLVAGGRRPARPSTASTSYEKALFDFDSKHITQPGNAQGDRIPREDLPFVRLRAGAAVVLARQLQARAARRPTSSRRCAGTVNPELSTSSAATSTRSPAAPAPTTTRRARRRCSRRRGSSRDDAAAGHGRLRVVHRRGSRAARQPRVRAPAPAEQKWQVVGALNNDMIGWAGEGSRMDNTIRYSNAGHPRHPARRRVPVHATSILYDAKYYRGTDAAAFYEGWGDIVGGIGSYPVLAQSRTITSRRTSSRR